MDMQKLIGWLGALVAISVMLGCDAGRTGPGKNGTEPVSSAASFSFRDAVIWEGFPDRLTTSISIRNKTEQKITQAYISASGAASFGGVQVLSESRPIKVGETYTSRFSSTANTAEGKSVSITLVAVVLEDGTMYGDGDVVHPFGYIPSPTLDDINSLSVGILREVVTPELLDAMTPEVRARYDERMAEEPVENVVLPSPQAARSTEPGGAAEPPSSRRPAALVSSISVCEEDLWGPDDLQVLHAEYGAGDATVDVTERVRDLVAGGLHGISVRSDTLGVPDPAVGELKTLTITLSIDGREDTWEGEEKSAIVLGRPGQVERLIGTVFPAIEVGDTRIVAAWYGAEDGWADVMYELHEMADRGSGSGFTFRCGAPFGDPKPNVVKVLRLYIERDGERLVAEFPERHEVRLPLE